MRMKIKKVFLFALLLSLLLGNGRSMAAHETDAGQISISVGRLLEQGHYSRRKLDDDLSRRLLNNYIESLDYNHLFFTQQDIDGFNKKFSTSLDDDILLGNVDPAFEIYDLYTKRVKERIAKIKALLPEKFAFNSKKTIDLNRQKLPWPKDDEEADALWHDRIEGEFLQEKLNQHPIDPPIKVLTRRYDQFLRNINEQTHEDVVKTFLNSLAQTYDPHSEYLSKSDLENFNITMRLSLVGIGAVLHSEDGYAKIMELVPGGPAQVDGHLKVGDRITAVAQGDSEFVDTVGMKLDKVVDKIRGKKGTHVRLQVISNHAADPSAQKIVEIVRDEVKLKDQAAKAELIETPGEDGLVQRLGWITLPSFYAEMENPNKPNAASTTKDVQRLLTRLKKENIGGLVIDLRKNGGGSLEEVINLTGLFIKKGPVVQVKDANGNRKVQKTRETPMIYDGPMIVLINRLSASASEIFVAALQDAGRAVIVGDEHSFGKGTVQTMVEIGRYIPFLGSDTNQAGALKLTIQKFYRIAGGSTQLHGVASDIHLPSVYDRSEIGETALHDPLPYDEVPPASYDHFSGALFLKQLRARSAARVAVNPEFRYIHEDLDLIKKRIAQNKISINEGVRRAEIAEEKTRKDKRIAERAKRKEVAPTLYAITLDNSENAGLELVKNEKKAAPAEESKDGKDPKDPEEDEDADSSTTKPEVDPVRTEALNIMNDMVSLAHAPKTVSTTPKLGNRN